MDRTIVGIVAFLIIIMVLVAVGCYFNSKYGKRRAKKMDGLPTHFDKQKKVKSPNFYRMYKKELQRIQNKYVVELDSLPQYKSFNGDKWIKQYVLSGAKQIYKNNLKVVDEFNKAKEEWEQQSGETYKRKVLTVDNKMTFFVDYSYTTPAGKNTYSNRFVKTYDFAEIVDVNGSRGGDFIPIDIWLDSELSVCEYTGVYIIHNIDKDMYYVGQAKNVGKRINQHRTGRGGNPDVYYDWRSGDQFYIKTISLSESGFDNLDRLEMYMIDLYDACISGYNKTVGNNV